MRLWIVNTWFVYSYLGNFATDKLRIHQGEDTGGHWGGGGSVCNMLVTFEPNYYMCKHPKVPCYWAFSVQLVYRSSQAWHLSGELDNILSMKLNVRLTTQKLSWFKIILSPPTLFHSGNGDHCWEPTCTPCTCINNCSPVACRSGRL